MQHTPRLCIDGRTALELPQTGVIAQELIDQLVAANGEEEASEWIQKHRTVLLSHPGQVFSGQLRRYETKRKVGNSPLYWMWEKEFVKTAGISFFHRFRAIDQMNVACSISTLTTILPPEKKLPFFLSRRPNQYFVVSSHKDLEMLQGKYQIAKERIFVAHPTVRRFVHFQELKNPSKETVLILVGDKENTVNLKKLLGVIRHRFPRLEPKVVSIRPHEELNAQTWLTLLSNAQLCFYLSSKPFDWGNLALESIFYKIPTVFPEENRSLIELLPQTNLSLARFLINQQDLGQLKQETERVFSDLKSRGVFEPLAMAAQYREIYRQVVPSTSH